jgi:uncharacterized protein (TIGR02996 family)
MTHEDAFLQDILENPEDDTPRRIYADWMLDHDDPVIAARGEFIHIQCDLAHLPAESPQAAVLLRRQDQLLETHAREWGSLYRRLGCTCWEYRRGFVEGAGMPAFAFLSQAATLFRSGPLRELKLYQAAAVVHDLAGCPYLARVRSLDLESNDLGDADLEVLTSSPHLGELSTLLLWCNRVGDAGVRALLGGSLPRLVRLDLSNNTVGDEGAEALAASLFLKQISMLDLTGNRITDAGALALAASPHAAGLAWLELAKNPISPAGLNVLRERFGGRVHVWG